MEKVLVWRCANKSHGRSFSFNIGETTDIRRSAKLAPNSQEAWVNPSDTPIAGSGPAVTRLGRDCPRCAWKLVSPGGNRFTNVKGSPIIRRRAWRTKTQASLAQTEDLFVLLGYMYSHTDSTYPVVFTATTSTPHFFLHGFFFINFLYRKFATLWFIFGVVMCG